MAVKKQTGEAPVLLLGAYGQGNIGDDVFIICATYLFKDRIIYINSTDDKLLPPAVRTKIHTIATGSLQGIYKKIQVFSLVKEVIYWGGDLWVELHGTKRPRKLLYKMILLNCLARLAGKKVYYVGSGVGDLSGFSLGLARLAGSMATSIVLREAKSATILQLPGKVTVLPDIAINLPYIRPRLHEYSPARPFSIVISVLWSIPNPRENFHKLIKAIAAFVDALPSDNFTVTLLPMHTSSQSFDDVWASQELQKLGLKQPMNIYDEHDLKSITRLLQSSDLVIGTRLHAALLAVLSATPTIGIAYRPKVSSFFVENGIGEYCLGLEEVGELKNLFHTMYHGYARVAAIFYEVSKRNLSKKTEYRRLIDGIKRGAEYKGQDLAKRKLLEVVENI